ncbi:MAG TPA: alpha/beta fold hydrolase [Terriglobia bacterium]|jgi:pimeloyl-ACP methyl ester carboxylesterase
MHNSWFRTLILSLSVFGLLVSVAHGQAFPRPRADAGPKPKNVRGLVTDSAGKPITGARVFIRDVKTKVVRTLETDTAGEYRVMALTPTVDYEVYAEYQGKQSEKKFVSSFLNREDNVLNFQLPVSAADSGKVSTENAPIIKAYDLVELHGSFEMPVGVPAPIPAVLLLHGYGEDRSVWKDFSRQLIERGWAVMTLDLRGHGESRMKNGIAVQLSPEWRTNSREFPLDLDPALDWLKSRPRVDGRKIVVIGSDIGADLALIASGRFPEVRTVVAINPKLDESLSLAGSAHDFQPQSSLIVTPNQAEGDRIKALVKPPSRVLVISRSGGTAQWAADKQVDDAIFQWLKETY